MLEKFMNFHNKCFSIIWGHTALSTIRDLVHQNLLKIEWQNRIGKFPRSQQNSPQTWILVRLRQFSNSIFSLNFQQILVNKVSNDRKMQYYIILWRKIYIFMKIQKFWAKKSFRSHILGKISVRSKQILVSCYQK